jgi:hypothetical protein
VCHLFLLYDNLFRQHLHGVDATSIPFPHLEDLSKGTLADELQNLEVLGTVVLLVDLVEVELEMDLTGDVLAIVLSGLQLKPPIIRMFVLDQVRTETDMAEEGFAV